MIQQLQFHKQGFPKLKDPDRRSPVTFQLYHDQLAVSLCLHILGQIHHSSSCWMNSTPLQSSCHFDLFMFCSGLWVHAKNSDLITAPEKTWSPVFLTLQCWRASSKAVVLTKTSACSCGLAKVNAALWLCFGLSYLWTWHSSAGVEPSLTPSGAVSQLWPPAPLSPEIKCPTQLPASAKLEKKWAARSRFFQPE